MYYCLLDHKIFPTFSCAKLGQCETCKHYERGDYPPNHPVPVIRHANYHERIVEARKQVRDAFCDLKNETKEHSV